MKSTRIYKDESELDKDGIDPKTFAEHSNKMSLLTIRKNFEEGIAKETFIRSSIGFIDDEYATDVRVSLILKKQSRLSKIIHRKIGQLLQSGIIQHFEQSQAVKKLAAQEKEEVKSREHAKQLTMEHLRLCFVAILIGLVLSCYVFAIERLVGFLSSL
jgi:hypothetical protein